MSLFPILAEHVIATARAYKGYQEKRCSGTRKQLWDFHWKPGFHNYTIWALLYQDYTGRNYQGQPWCAMFGSDVVVLALIEHCHLPFSAAVSAAKQLYGGDLPYNCQLFISQQKGDARLNHTPKAGSAVIFHTGARYGHFGIVTGVDSDGKGFTSVEGNTSGGANQVDPDGGAVVEKWHSLSPLTYFWHFDYDKEPAALPPQSYSIQSGVQGLTVTADALNIRSLPKGNKTGKVYRQGQTVFPSEKTFVDGKAWYLTNPGWISAGYLTGWVLEENNRWWYLMPGYTFSVNNWQLIDGQWYYFDSAGYMVSSQWIQHNGQDYYLTAAGQMARNCYVKSVDQALYYWVGNDGAWQPEWNTATPDLDQYQAVI